MQKHHILAALTTLPVLSYTCTQSLHFNTTRMPFLRSHFAWFNGWTEIIRLLEAFLGGLPFNYVETTRVYRVDQFRVPLG